MLGQAYLGFPESVVLNDSVGSVENPGTAGGYNRGRTLTHELGHNFTYPQPFAASSCSSPIWSDVPAKTEPNYQASLVQEGTTGNWYGNGAGNECIGTTNKGDQFMNFMDYVLSRINKDDVTRM